MRLAPCNTYPYLVFRYETPVAPPLLLAAPINCPEQKFTISYSESLPVNYSRCTYLVSLPFTHPVACGHSGSNILRHIPAPSTVLGGQDRLQATLRLSRLIDITVTSTPLRQYLSVSSFYMSDLKERLARLGLAQYSEVFATEGFDTWETVLDITESDL